MERLNQQELVSIIRGWHQYLRKQVKNAEDGEDATVWEKCCENAEQLEKYAKAMHSLATTFWETNNEQTRIDWCYSVCKEYFYEGGYEKLLEKWRKRHKGKQIPLCEPVSDFNPFLPKPEHKLLLLDVGSCYNPFHKYDDILSVGIDLNPATDDVRKCDFLKLIVGSKLTASVPQYVKTLPNIVKSLPTESFHVVVFSLLLEYLPTAKQRWTSCVKAYDLLVPNGVLLIVSPDSKHQNHNAAMVKSWRKALEHLAFKRIKYDKQTHLHCMAFVKNECRCILSSIDKCDESSVANVDTYSITPATTKKCSCSDKTLTSMMFIPQDLHDYPEKDPCYKRINKTENEEFDVRDCFSELPEEY